MNDAKAGIAFLMILAVPLLVFAESSAVPVEIEEQTTKVNLLDGSAVEVPHPIEGPKPVCMDQGTCIVRSIQQIVVSPDGTAIPPFSFSGEETWMTGFDGIRCTIGSCNEGVLAAKRTGQARSLPRSYQNGY